MSVPFQVAHMRRKGTDLEALRSVEVVVNFQLDSLVVVSTLLKLSALGRDFYLRASVLDMIAFIIVNVQISVLPSIVIPF